VKVGRTRRIERKRGQKLRGIEQKPENVFVKGKRGHEVAFGEAWLSEKREPMGAIGNVGQAIANPSEAAKVSGMPNSLMVTCPEVETRALRAGRSSHERR
jgi:hypothetical protein